MDLSSPTPTTNSPLIPVFGDNVQDLLGRSALNVNPSAIITVNSTADTVNDYNSGVTTLRDAINQSHGDTGEDLIVFDRSLFTTAQTITLNLDKLDITSNVDIIAPRDPLTGGDLLTVSGNNASRVFEIVSGATLNLDGLIVANGYLYGDGGGIKNSGTLTLDNSIVRNNSTAYTGYRGGGIYNTDTLVLNSSTISGNSAKSSGGAIYSSGTVSVSNSIISGNSALEGGGIYNTGNINVNDSTISGNSVTGAGGGIYNTGNVEVNASTISGNSASHGGGFYNDGTSAISTVSNSTISGNIATGIGFSNGGGFYNDIGAISTVSNSTISDNSAVLGDGGGIYRLGGTITVSSSTISGNSAAFGGGIYNGGSYNSGASIVSNSSTISGNSADNNGGGIYNTYNSMITVSNSTISGNSANKNGASRQGEGGGIYNSGTVEVSYSTINGNSAIQNAGGIYNDSTFKVSNSTISGNSTNGAGGGIYNSLLGNLTLVFSTLTLNSAANGSGVFNSTASYVLDKSTVSARNTIIAGNELNENGVNPDVSGIFTSNGYNLIGDNIGSTGFDEAIGDIVGTSDNPIDPRLAPLDFYGGPTQTIALLPNSPAIDAADPTVLDTDPTTDQRGLPRVSGGRADIGAFEVQV